jgi:glycine/D-amino acid oxidase-like deaminating enzyme
MKHALGILDDDDRVLERFILAYVHPLVRRDPRARGNAAADLNNVIDEFGYHLTQVGRIENPQYELAGNYNGYEVVLSFAGEQRAYVEAVAALLRENGVTCFYDNYEVHTLWGKNLIEHLQQVYGGAARFCVMFVSAAYAEKVWPTHERLRRCYSTKSRICLTREI